MYGPTVVIKGEAYDLLYSVAQLSHIQTQAQEQLCYNPHLHLSVSLGIESIPFGH